MSTHRLSEQHGVPETWAAEWERFQLLRAFAHHRSSRRTWRRALKRALDVGDAAAALVAFAPVMAVVAAAVRLESRGSAASPATPGAMTSSPA